MKASILLLTGLVCELAVAAQTNAVSISFTNAPATPFYTPTPEQKKIEGVYFKTIYNKFDEVVLHIAVNTDHSPVVTAMGRKWSRTQDDCFWAIAREDDRYRYRFGDEKYSNDFDTTRGVTFLIDHRRLTFTNTAATDVVEQAFSGKSHTVFICQVSKDVVEQLGNCKSASVRVPQVVGNFDYDFTEQELKRFALFAKAYLPSTNASVIKIK